MNKPDIIELSPQNLAQQHICCALSSTPDARRCAAAKKEWLAQNYALGYRFNKLDVQGKAFIETVPGQNAWAPILASGWLFIDCFWVAGQYKGQGVASRLLQTALDTARAGGFAGLVALAADKKRPFLGDPGFYAHKGFRVADEATPYYRLMALPLEENTSMPRFNKSVLNTEINTGGIVVYYTAHCPHTTKYVPLLQQAATQKGATFEARQLQTLQQAQNAPNPFTSWAMYYDGRFVTNEIFSEGKLVKFLESQEI